MKASREQLKALVKELLIEVLQEGIGPVQSRPVAMGEARRPQAPRQQQGQQRRPPYDPRLDAPVGKRVPSDALKEAVKLEANGNAVLADILADTAMTTLPTQLSHGDSMGRPSPGGGQVVSRGSAPVQQEQFNGDPTEIFAGGSERADGTSHWADLAFLPSKKPL